MINRRLIRIKVFKVLYSSVLSGNKSISQADKQLLHSCEDTLKLYHFIFGLAVALRNAAEEKIETGLKKFIPTEQEAAPNRRFVENQVSAILSSDAQFCKYCNDNALIWSDERRTFVRKLLFTVTERDYFKAYMSSDDSSLAADCDLFSDIFANEVDENEELEEMLEEMSIYWMDDLTYVINVILKNLSVLKNRKQLLHPSVFLKDDDKDFACQLLAASLEHYDEYMEQITANVPNWDPDRMVAADMFLIEQGIAEAVCFPNIPSKVTINEYVELSKFYSTANSKVFVNGLLDRMIQHMIKDGSIVKSGRGLKDS